MAIIQPAFSTTQATTSLFVIMGRILKDSLIHFGFNKTFGEVFENEI